MNRIEAFEALKRGDYVYNINNPNCIYHINTINQPGGKIIIQYLNSDKYEFFVHMCDYLSSKKFLDVKFDEDNNVRTR